MSSILKHLQSKSSQRVTSDELIISFDVVSLFISIPVNLAISIVKRKPQETNDWKAQTNLTQNQILTLLSLILAENSFFKFEGTQYHQVFGCAMGSPVSAVIAELTMEQVEEEGLASSPVKPKWWRQYLDDSNACLKRDDVEPFHKHLNSVNPHIQFTIEMLSTSTGNPMIPFLDTNTTVLPDGRLEVNGYCKATDTNKYLSFDSHSPAQSKRAVVKTLLDRAKSLPSSTELRRNEEQRVVNDLKANE